MCVWNYARFRIFLKNSINTRLSGCDTDACGVQGNSVVGGAGGLTYVEEINTSVNLSIKIEIKRLKT